MIETHKDLADYFGKTISVEELSDDMKKQVELLFGGIPDKPFMYCGVNFTV